MTTEMSYRQAITEALDQELARDPSVYLIGEDIGVYGGAFGATKGLLEKHGPDRVRDAPIAESGIVGLATGSALMGMRPVVEIMFMDFITIATDQLVNHAAKFPFIYGDQAKVALTVRTPAGAGRGYGATHSQSLEAWFVHVPGLKVVTPATPSDAAELLVTSIRDDGPVLFVENKLLYPTKGDVALPIEPRQFGQAAVRREGTDVTLIAYGRMVSVALEAAEALSPDVEAEVVDLRTLVPLDVGTVVASVEKTMAAVVVEEDVLRGGVGAEVLAVLAGEAFYSLDAPLARVGCENLPIPSSPVLESAVLPTAEKVAAEVLGLLDLRG